MARFTTPAKKEEVLSAIISVFEQFRDEYEENPRDERSFGGYVAMMVLLNRVKIYDKEE